MARSLAHDQPSATVQRLLGCLKSVRRRGKGWMAECPAHDDRNPSLSVSQGHDGRALVFCHAGCSTEGICRSIGWTSRDLMNDREAAGGRSPQSTKAKAPKSSGERNSQSPPKVYASLDAAIAAQATRLAMPCTNRWHYTHADGTAFMAVARFDVDGRKEYRPFRAVDQGNGWSVGDPEGLLPLYALPEIARAGAETLVLVVEGEQCGDLARSLGFVCTTSAHGARAAPKSDWSPLTGRRVVILPDNDEEGRRYAKAVCAILIDRGCRVCVAALPGLEDGEDLVEFVARRRGAGASDEAIREEIRQIVDRASEAASIPPAASGDDGASVPPNNPPPISFAEYVPFPTHTLPEPLRSLCEQGAKALFCDPAMIAVPALATVSAAIGATRRVLLKESWAEHLAIWGAVIMRSGANKSAAHDLAVEPLMNEQNRLMAEFEGGEAARKRKKVDYDAALVEWRKSGRKGGEPPPDEPVVPPCPQFILGDTTIEAVAKVLQGNPRGALVSRDELGGWILSFGQYKPGKSGDTQSWLELHRGSTLLSNRASRSTIRIPRALMSVCGTIQPGTFARALTPELFDSGLAARLLVVMPVVRRKRWSEDTVSPRVKEKYANVVRALRNLEFRHVVGCEDQPIDVSLSEGALTLWSAFYDEFADEQAAAETDNEAACLAKLEGYAARFALIFRLVRDAAEPDTQVSALAVEAQDMEVAVRLTKWFAHEARRVYAMVHEDEDSARRREIVDWMRRLAVDRPEWKVRGVSPNELRASSRRFRTNSDAEAALVDLVSAGDGVWLPEVGGMPGRPTRRFRLVDWPAASPKPEGKTA